MISLLVVLGICVLCIISLARFFNWIARKLWKWAPGLLLLLVVALLLAREGAFRSTEALMHEAQANTPTHTNTHIP